MTKNTYVHVNHFAVWQKVTQNMVNQLYFNKINFFFKCLTLQNNEGSCFHGVHMRKGERKPDVDSGYLCYEGFYFMIYIFQ